MKITFLAHSVDHIGGTIRATLNTAAALAERGHQVEIATVFKDRQIPLFTPDPRVKITPLVDRTRRAKRPTAIKSLRDRFMVRQPSRVYPAGDTRFEDFSVLTDRRVEAFLRNCDADVIVGTRPGLNVYLAQFAPRRAVTVAQEHLFYSHHKPELRQALSTNYRRVDALVTVSEADAENYRARMPHLVGKVSFIPNSIIPTTLPTSTGENKLIVAAGRVEKSKRFDMLLKCFAEVNKRHPDWKLRVYGKGKHLSKLRDIVEKYELSNVVTLMGQRTPLDPEWVKGSIAAMTSKYESFGMTIVEAMNCGLPVVSTACDFGPPEIIDHGIDGLLTPRDDRSAFIEGLCSLIEDDAMRKRMSVAAEAKARRYFPAAIGADYEQLFDNLVRTKERTPPHGMRAPTEHPVSHWLGLPVVSASAGAAAVAEALPVAHELIADCTSHSFEDITLRLRQPAGQLEFVDVAEKHPPVIVRLSRDRNTATVRMDAATMAKLPEGVWYAQHHGARVATGRIDSRELLRTIATPPGTVVIPHAEKGRFALRVWRRAAYAEINEVNWRDTTVHVTGRLLGTDWTGAAVSVLARRRGDGHERRFPAGLDDDGGFAIAVPADPLASERSNHQDLWDLWLVDETHGRTPIRIGRFFDDIALRKPTQRFGFMVRNEQRPGRVRPYYTTDNELSISVIDTDQAISGAA